MKCLVTSQADQDDVVRMLDAAPNLRKLILNYESEERRYNDDALCYEIPMMNNAPNLHTLTIESSACKLTHRCPPNLKVLTACLDSDEGSQVAEVPETLEYVSVFIRGDGENITDVDEMFGRCTRMKVLDLTLVDAMGLCEMASKMHRLEVLKMDVTNTDTREDWTEMDLMRSTALYSFGFFDEELGSLGYSFRLPPSLETLYLAGGHKVEFPEGCPMLTGVCMNATTDTLVLHAPSEWHAIWKQVQVAVLTFGHSVSIDDVESPLDAYVLPAGEQMTIYLVLETRDHYMQAEEYLRGVFTFANRVNEIVFLYNDVGKFEELGGPVVALIKSMCPNVEKFYHGAVPFESQQKQWALLMDDMQEIPYIDYYINSAKAPDVFDLIV